MHYINCLREGLGLNNLEKIQFGKNPIHRHALRSPMRKFCETPRRFCFPLEFPNIPISNELLRFGFGYVLNQVSIRIFTPLKDGLQKYYDLSYVRSGFLNNSKELLENKNAHALFEVDSIKTFDFSTLYTAITNNKLNSILKEIINNCCFYKN